MESNRLKGPRLRRPLLTSSRKWKHIATLPPLDNVEVITLKANAFCYVKNVFYLIYDPPTFRKVISFFHVMQISVVTT